MRRNHGLTAWVIIVVAGALAALATLPLRGIVDHAWTLALLVVLTGAVGGRPVRIAALNTLFTATHPFMFCALAAFGPAEAVLVDLVGIFGTLAVQEKRPRRLKLVYNVGAVILSVWTSWLVFRWAGGVVGGRTVDQILPLVWATGAYFLANTGLIAAAIAIERQRNFFDTWRSSYQWTIVSYLTGLSLAVGLLFLLQALGPWGLALGVPPGWLLLEFYRAYRARLEEQERRIAEIEALNQELEQKVAERTRALRSALNRIEETNQQLRETNQQLVDANRAKSAFLAKVSHELRTPLNAILGFSDLLNDCSFGPLAEQQLGFVADIRDSGEHLLELINDILDLSKIEAGKMTVNLQPTRVHDTVQDVMGMLRPLAAKKNIRLSQQLDPQIEEAVVDRGMLRQILINLMGNAVKFTPEGGSVSLTTQREGAQLIVQVRDTGIGIPVEDRERIFQEFYQVDGSYSRSYQGTGLGLALCLRMMDLHQGTLEVESEPGRGSTFTCRFPEAIAEQPADAPQALRTSMPPPQAAQFEPGILVIDAAPLDRKLIRNALRPRGHQVWEATSLTEGLQMLERRRPRLVLVDLQLPEPGGLETVRRIRADPRWAAVKIAALSAGPEPLMRPAAREAGCCGYIAKPIVLSRFPAQLERLLELDGEGSTDPGLVEEGAA